MKKIVNHKKSLNDFNSSNDYLKKNIPIEVFELVSEIINELDEDKTKKTRR